MNTLRSSLIRLAHANPEIRRHVLPLLKEASPQADANEVAGRMLMHDRDKAGESWPPVSDECRWEPDEILSFIKKYRLPNADPKLVIRAYERQLRQELRHFEQYGD